MENDVNKGCRENRGVKYVGVGKVNQSDRAV